MSTLEMEALKAELARYILETESRSLLDKIKNFITREQHEGARQQEETMSKEEILAELKTAFHTAKLAREGKIKGRPVEELLHEL